MPGPARARRRPRERSRADGRGSPALSGSCAQGDARELRPRWARRLEEPLAIDELAAGEPGQCAALENLDVCGRGIVVCMVLAVLREPGSDRGVRVDARHTLSVEQDRVVRHQPPAAAYATAPLAASAACAAARRASGTR